MRRGKSIARQKFRIESCDDALGGANQSAFQRDARGFRTAIGAELGENVVHMVAFHSAFTDE